MDVDDVEFRRGVKSKVLSSKVKTKTMAQEQGSRDIAGEDAGVQFSSVLPKGLVLCGRLPNMGTCSVQPGLQRQGLLKSKGNDWHRNLM